MAGITDAKLRDRHEYPETCRNRPCYLTLASLHVRLLHEWRDKFFEIVQQIDGLVAPFNGR